MEASIATYDVFLSYNSRDQATVRRIAQRLEGDGIKPWLDVWALTPGGEWQHELGAGLESSGACAVFIGPDDLGDWELQEVALAIDRAAKERGFRVFPVLLQDVREPFEPNRLPHFLRTRTWVDFRRGHEDKRALQDLIHAIHGIPFGPDTVVVRSDDKCPYRGLRVFDVEDEEFYFGRDAEIQRLLEKLKTDRFLAVLGPSGSGKSSLVRAGLVPALLRGALPGGETWERSIIRPGAAPLTALAAAVSALEPQTPIQATLDLLASDPRTLHLAVVQALGAGRRLVLVVDQLEEVFTLCTDDTERRALFSNLLYAAAAPGGPCVVVLTLRADFYPRCAPYPELSQLVSGQQLLVSPMDRTAARQAIEEPARRVGLEFEEGLVDTILDDVGSGHGSLPLLEHALLELWERRRGRMLTLEGYRDAGRVDGALAKRADEIVAGLSPADQEIARNTLLRLTQPGDGTEDTRRRAALSELQGAGVQPVLDQLVAARLLTTSSEDGEELVDVSHEALIRAWPRLRGWIDADRAGLRVLRRLTEAAQEWERLDRDDSALYRGVRLAEVRECDQDQLNPLEREFAEASAALSDREAQELEARRRSELESARRGRRRLLVAVLALVTALVATGAAVLVTGHQRSVAVDARNTARDAARSSASVALAAAANENEARRPDVSLLMGLAASELSPRAEARGAMIGALENAYRSGAIGVLGGHLDGVSAVAFSHDGRTLASAGFDRTARLWDVAGHREQGTPLRVAEGFVNGVAFTPDDRTLATAGQDHVIRLWNVATQKQIGQLVGHTDRVYCLAISPDGTLLASSGEDNRVLLWNLRTGKQVAEFGGSHLGVYSVEFSPDGRTLASAGNDDEVRLWDVKRLRPAGKPLRGHGNFIRSVAFSPDSKTLASASDDKTVRVWDVKAGRLKKKIEASTEFVRAVAFSPDGKMLASAGFDRQIHLWNAHTFAPIGAPLSGHTLFITSLAFSPDSRTLASASFDDTLRLWDVQKTRQIDTVLRGHHNTVTGVAYANDGRTLASSGAGGGVQVWRSDAPAGDPLTPSSPAGGMRAVAFARDGQTLASGSDDGSVRLWNAQSHAPIGDPLPGRAGGVTSVAFSPDGRELAAGTVDGAVRLWKTGGAGWQEDSVPPREHTKTVYTVAFSPDGKLLASGSEDNTIRFWDAHTARPLAVLIGHTDGVTSVVFSPDGRSVASAARDRTVRLWDVRSRQQRGTPLIADGHPLNAVAFSPDGRTVAAAGDGGAIVLWDPRTRRPLGTPLTGHAGAITALTFSPDGQTLASSGADRTVRLWNGLFWPGLGELKRRVCKLVGRGLTKSEWAVYASEIAYQPTCR